MPVEKVEMFRTSDGGTFESELKAVHHQSVLDSVKAVKIHLPSADKIGMDEYYQLTADQVKRFIDGYVAVTKNFYGVDKLMMEGIAVNVRSGLVGRMLCDGDSPIYGLFLMLESIDSQNRLWNQPYYVNNPPKEPVCINA